MHKQVGKACPFRVKSFTRAPERFLDHNPTTTIIFTCMINQVAIVLPEVCSYCVFLELAVVKRISITIHLSKA